MLAVLDKRGEAEISTILFFQYLLSMATLPAWTWLFIHISQAWT